MGALLALAAPASSMAANFGMFPAGHNFEIKGPATPLISGPLAGYCDITKITGTVPPAPKNEAAAIQGPAVVVPIAQPTFSCGSGMSVTVAGEWSMRAYTGFIVWIMAPGNSLTIRYSSLPGCKLASSSANYLKAAWSNGTTSPLPSHSGFTAAALRTNSGVDQNLSFTWQKDGSSACALEGKTEELAFRTNPVFGNATVTDTTNPSENVILTSGF